MHQKGIVKTETRAFVLTPSTHLFDPFDQQTERRTLPLTLVRTQETRTLPFYVIDTEQLLQIS